MNLKNSLMQFQGSSDETELQKMFRILAPSFLYGGFIQVRNDYQIFIRTVEFYFHSEKPNGIHDPIVYHRNGRDLEIIPYFPLMTLHAHASGFDITFESEEREYRASALIRSYEVKDKDGNFLIWGKDEQNKRSFVKSHSYGFNTQSTYLYILLNGFTLDKGNEVRWVDSPMIQSKVIQEKRRQNVYQYDITGKKIQCDRNWSFTREEQV